MSTQRVLAAIAVTDIEKSIQWYEQLLGRKLDERPMKEAAEWYLTQGGGIQLVLDKERAGKSLVTVGISAIDELVRDLKSRGIDARTSNASGAFRLAQVRDVDGNQLTFAQDQRAGRSG